MQKKEVIEYFGNQAKTAKALNISKTAVCKWPERLSDLLSYRIEVITGGALKSDETIRRNGFNL